MFTTGSAYVIVRKTTDRCLYSLDDVVIEMVMRGTLRLGCYRLMRNSIKPDDNVNSVQSADVLINT